MLALAILATIGLAEAFIGLIVFAMESYHPFRDFIVINVCILVVIAFAAAFMGVGLLWEAAV